MASHNLLLCYSYHRLRFTWNHSARTKYKALRHTTLPLPSLSSFRVAKAERR